MPSLDLTAQTLERKPPSVCTEDILSRSNWAVKPGLMVQERVYPSSASNRPSTIEINEDH